jgi:hypothetical protein
MIPLITREQWEKERVGCARLHQGTQDSVWCITEENGMEIKGYCSYAGCTRVTGRT